MGWTGAINQLYSYWHFSQYTANTGFISLVNVPAAMKMYPKSIRFHRIQLDNVRYHLLKIMAGLIEFILDPELCAWFLVHMLSFHGGCSIYTCQRVIASDI